MGEQHQPDTDVSGKRGTRKNDDAEAQGRRGPEAAAGPGTDAEPDVEGHARRAVPEGRY